MDAICFLTVPLYVIAVTIIPKKEHTVFNTGILNSKYGKDMRQYVINMPHKIVAC